ncbi:proton-coupled zinc antiporter SLC30A1-like [Lethenteron reissneri]|uniref:proton-coupled zinc antiporter SLC30A1-like n=1 Tax=Lethenteron reissneri TaxID=7753 RepID=UPI002AB6B5E7|nr:proton-coupled zinc antiporter SLC30A1-like [Lethenteron reissneri]
MRSQTRLICMLCLTLAFFVVEVVVSRVSESLAMLSDSLHMLSDVIALGVALLAVRLAGRTRPTRRNSFGWARAEVAGALVNSVFLVALCVTIVLEALGRFAAPRTVERPLLVVVVGAVGLLVNLVGLCLFQGHGHSHGEAAVEGSSGPVRVEEEVVEATGSQMNMHGVFLHVLGDALGSVAVVVNALVYSHFEGSCVPEEARDDGEGPAHRRRHHRRCWVHYLDPSLCLLIVAILLSTAVPLLRDSALILMQAAPGHVDLRQLREGLARLDGVVAVQDMRVWQLAGSRLVGTARVACAEPADGRSVVRGVRRYFRQAGIGHATIQTEFVGRDHPLAVARRCS